MLLCHFYSIDLQFISIQFKREDEMSNVYLFTLNVTHVSMMIFVCSVLRRVHDHYMMCAQIFA